MPAWDPTVTVGLLVLGLINVTQTVAQARDLGVVLNAFFVQEGIGAYTNAQAASVAGLLLAATNLLCLVLAIGFAVPRLRRHRRAFWIPLVSAAISVVATTVVVAGAVMSDPAFFTYLQSHS